MANKQFVLNTAATILNLLIQLSISFFLTSYLVKSIGATAYGFYGMANTVVNYALIITNALNSMAARFIGFEIYNHNKNKAQSYFSSVLVGDILFALIVLVPSLLAIWHLDSLINIPPNLVSEVKLLFFIVFINMCCNVICAVFGSVYTIKNRLDIQSFLTIISNILKAGLLLILYISYRPSIVYLGTATLIATIIFAIGNIHYTRKYLPEVRINLSYATFKSVKDIILSGIWNSINQLSVTLLHGLDLLLANVMICAEAMGILSLAGTLPGVISMCVNSLANVFTPNLLEYFSKGQFDYLMHELKNSIKFMTVVSCMPISFLIAFGVPFFKLWTPNTDIYMLYFLTILIMLPQFSGGAISSMNYLYTIANKVKWQAVVLFGSGIVNVVVVYCLLKFSDIGVYAVVLVSAIISFFRNLCFNAPYAAYCIKQKYYVFWPDMLKSSLSLLACSLGGLFLTCFFAIDSWIEIIIIGGGYTVVSGFGVALMILSKEQRLFLLSRIKKI